MCHPFDINRNDARYAHYARDAANRQVETVVRLP